MPIEIRELHIRIAVETKAGGQLAAKSKGDRSGGGDKDAIVEECVEQVLRIMESRKER